MPKIITPDQIDATTLSASYRLNLDGQFFDFLSNYSKHSVEYVGSDTLRFELHDAEQFDWDKRSGMSSERTQIASKTLFANKQPLEIGFDLNIEQGQPNTAQWLVLGQIHLAEWTGNLTGKSPPVEIGMIGEKMVVKVRYAGADGKTVEKAVFTDLNDIQRGHHYQIDIKAVIDPDGTSRLVVTRDGTIIADYSGQIGYPGQQKVLWGEGIYRAGNATETMVAEFGNLTIKTDDAVKMPAADAFIDAPKLLVDKVGAALADGSRVATVSGTAKAGTTVTVTNGDIKLGTAKVDADGHFVLNVKIPSGAETLLGGIATDTTGRSGIEAKPVAIEVGTGAEIGAKLQSLIAQGNVAKIVITDGTVLSSAGFNLTYIFKYGADTLSKIQGNFSFYQSVKASGSYYDRLDQYYDAKGVLTQFVRYANGVEKYREAIDADGTRHITDKATAGQTTILDVTKAGLITRSDQYNAAGILTVRNLKGADGSSEQHLYDAKTGLEFKYVVKAADGSSVVGSLNLPNRPFTSDIMSYDKAGKPILQVRYEADGTMIMKQVWKSDGTVVNHSYDGVTGLEKAFTVTASDGSRVETTLKPGQPDQILKTISYDAAGKVVAQTTGGTVPADPDGSTPVKAPAAETPVVVAPKPVDTPVVVAPTPVASTPAAPTPTPTASTPVYAVDAKTGLKTGYTQTASDGTKTTVTFKPGQEDKLLTKTVLFANGKPALSETYDGAGTKTWAAVYSADGSHVNTQFGLKGGAYDKVSNVYNAAEKVVGSTQMKGDKIVSEWSLDAGGAKLTKTYAANGTATVAKTDAFGKLVATETYDAAGKLTWNSAVAADGSKVNTQYGIKAATYDSLQNIYDASNKVVSTVLLKDGHVVLQTKVAEGSSQSHTFDGLWRETSATYTAADKTKDTFVFSYNGDSATITRAQQDHYNGTTKLWTDVTDASGNHLQTSYSSGVRLESHDHVTDTFVSGGRDTFVFTKGSGNDVIRNFATAAASHDVIEFDHADLTSFSQLHFAASGRDTVITFGTADSITVENVAPSQLKSDYFLFT